MRGPIDVIAYSKRMGSGTAADALVVFEDVNGDSRTSYTDAAGHASGEIEVGGTVWLLEDSPPGQSPGPWITAYTDVQPGETIQIGPEPGDHAVRGTMMIDGTPPMGTESIVANSSCRVESLDPRTITFDDRCGTTADVLLMASHFVGGPTGSALVKYIYLPAQPIIDGGTITIDPDAWISPEEPPTLTFTNASNALTYMVRNPLAFEPNRVPRVGKLRITGMDGVAYFDMLVPATVVSTPIDVDRILPPAVISERSATGVTWSIPEGSPRTVDAVINDYTWIHPEANYELRIRVQIYSLPSSSGAMTIPALPSEMAKYQPGSEFQISRAGSLIRTDRVDIDPRRLAELAPVFGAENVPDLSSPMAGWSIGTSFIP